ncbi:STAS domain-containing protein [Streptomyces sp. NPDC002055]|uniref:STAS domain-containing protein n=1 Tax=Streptomyces sp. NPDC002055 TaxID=3154534 RepID=UPI00333063B5
MQDFDIISTTQGSLWRLRPQGEIDIDARPAVHRALGRRPATARDLAVDMTEVSFMDIVGLQLMARVDTDARSHGLGVTFTGWQRQPRHLLAVAGDFIRVGTALSSPYARDAA